jgi:2-methylcitrate dehydratase
MALRAGSFGLRAARATQCRSFSHIVLGKDTNQALGLGHYAIDMLSGKYGDDIDASVYKVVEQFHTDSVMCGLSALTLKTNAPNVLKREAIEDYSTGGPGAYCLGSKVKVAPEKAIVANASAVREWDSNGTVFGYNAKVPGHQAGEFGHNDFYPVVIAAADMTESSAPIDGKKALKAMIVLDEIRGRLAEVFSLKSYKIDHVVHGAIASAATYGALVGATPEEIESAIGMTVAHYVPFRAIRAGKQLSDSKGASAAISTEAAVLSVKRAMRGFVGPKDIFRNPESIFRFFEPTTGGTASNKDIIDITLSNKVRWGVGDAPFNLNLSTAGSDFAVCGMHFKLGLYEHQSAGAIEGIIQLMVQNEDFMNCSLDDIKNINIVAYEPAFGIIGDPAKKEPKTRQSADHSMAFIVSRILKKALLDKKGSVPTAMDDVWMSLMLSPYDYGAEAIKDKVTFDIMSKITFEHGGKKYDDAYPDGIPTSLVVTLKNGKSFDSGFVMYPSGHARNTTANLDKILDYKNREMLGPLIFGDAGMKNAYIDKLINIKDLSTVAGVYSFDGHADMIGNHPPIDGA